MQEIVSLRTERNKVYDLGKGKRRISASLGPVHYKDDYSNLAEDWKDIDLTLVDGKITKAPFELTVGKDSIIIKDKRTGDTTELIIVEAAGKDFRLGKNIKLERTGYKLNLPHSSVIHVSHNKLNSSVSISEKADGSDRPEKYDFDTESFTKEVSSDIDVKVGASTDDAIERDGSWINLTILYGIIGDDGSTAKYDNGLRFTGITIPDGATVDSAYIK